MVWKSAWANKLSFSDSFQFLSTSLDSLVKNLEKDDFRHFSQEFDSEVLDLVKQKKILSLWVDGEFWKV